MTKRFLASAFFTALLSGLTMVPASAATINVNTLANELNNDGDCSLREAVSAANNNIVVDACVAGSAAVTDNIRIFLAGGIEARAIAITESVRITGLSGGFLTLNGGGADRIFRVNIDHGTQVFELFDITMRGGRGAMGGAVLIERARRSRFNNVVFNDNITSSANGSGGAIHVATMPESDASLEVTACTFTDNVALVSGGAINTKISQAGLFGVRTIQIRESRFADNLAAGFGGAVAVGRPDVALVERSQFERNRAQANAGGFDAGLGGALFLDGLIGGTSLFTVSQTSFIENEAVRGAGAILIYAGATSVVNSTFSGNFSESVADAHAISAQDGAVLAIAYSTFINNGQGSSDDKLIRIIVGSTASLRNSIFWADWEHMDDCIASGGSSFTSLGGNIDATGTCTSHGSDRPMTNPLLLPLSSYGDDTAALSMLTHLPSPLSPAIDIFQTGSCPGPLGSVVSIDQRGDTKPVVGPVGGQNRCDAGAVEYQTGMEPEAYRLQVVVVGNGSVTSGDGIDCPGNCAEAYLAGASVTLTASAEAGFTFTGWSGDCPAGTGNCTLAITGNRDVVATFAADDRIFADGFEP
ncbi:InlB B-repeat-containing protein [Dokdonella sp.]|uniref:InlB B-repeat-containing protein n=1 Tax=Dokdonella sp. TaxID=2291710 RepID=UPI003C3A13D7